MGHLAALLRAEQGINLIDSWEMVCVLMWVCVSIRNPSMTQVTYDWILCHPAVLLFRGVQLKDKTMTK